jgi:hypothetical protein
MKGSRGNTVTIFRNEQKKTDENRGQEIQEQRRKQNRGQEIQEQRRKQNPGKKYTTMNVTVKRKN